MAVDFLTKERGMCYVVRRGHDVFTIFDLIYLPNYMGITSFFQVTTKEHLWNRRQKIVDFREKHGLPRFSYLMAWDYRSQQFVIERL